MANYHHGGGGPYGMAAAAWREPESPQLSLMSGCSSLFSISALRDDDADLLLAGGGALSLPSTPVSFGGFAGGGEVDMELRQGGSSSSGGDDRRTVRMMRNRESALRSRARKRPPCQFPGVTKILANQSCAHVLPSIGEKLNCSTWYGPGLANFLGGNQTTASAQGHANFLAYVEELEKEVRRLVDDNLKLKKQCKELKQEVARLVLPTKNLLRRTSSTQF
ncbi:unnamed protein product [Alopecurus aequalis]